MTPRENLLRAARRRNPDWIPFDFGVSKGARAMFHEHLGDDVNWVEHFKFDARWFGPSEGTRRPTPDWAALYYADEPLPEGAVINPEWGVAAVELAETDDRQMFHPLRHITSVAELDAYPYPEDLGAPFRYAGVAEKVRNAQQQGFAVFGAGINYFETLWGITGFETLLMGMAMDEDWARKLFAKHTAALVRTAERIAETGADLIQTGSDVATQQAPLMSESMWRDWLFPMMRDVIAAAKRVNPDILILYHSDGNVEPLIGGLIEAGIDILDPVQPECMDIFAVKDKYGDRLSFHGGIGVQSVMPFGTPQDVRDTVRRTIDYMSKNGGGYLCSPAHMIRPEVPWDNVLALVETVKEYGHP